MFKRDGLSANNMTPHKGTGTRSGVFELVPPNEKLSSNHLPATEKEPDAVLPRKARKILSGATLAGFSLDMLMLILSLLFVAYAALVYQQDRHDVESKRSRYLVQAARAGPTIFAIVFAAVVGSLLKTIAMALLEAGTTVGTIEYLLSSRTVSSAAMSPIRLRYFHPLVLSLLPLWALSPLGGQAALRVVSETGTSSVSTHTLYWLDTNATGFMPALGPSNAQTVGYTMTTTFNMALNGPPTAKLARQDLYGNLKVPLREAIMASQTPDSSGWYNISSEADTTYASLIGLPLSGLPVSGNSTFAIRTSYLYSNCVILAKASETAPKTKYNVTDETGTYIFYDLPASGWAKDLTTTHFQFYTGINGPALIHANCNLAQKGVEIAVSCIDALCNTTAIREAEHDIPALPSFFGTASWSWSYEAFFLGLLNAAISSPWGFHVGETNPLTAYLADPLDLTQSLNSSVSSTVFSRRLSQLINTWWLAGGASGSVTGKFVPNPDNQYATSPMNSRNLTVTVSTAGQPVFICNRSWLIVLLFCSLVMVLAAIATAVLNATRKGPDILDAFTLGLRNNNYALAASSSMEDGAEIAKRLKSVKVRIGDVQPEAEIGHVAIGTPTAAQPVKRLRQGRLYD